MKKAITILCIGLFLGLIHVSMVSADECDRIINALGNMRTDRSGFLRMLEKSQESCGWEIDRTGLEAFYLSLNGPGWYNQTNWLTETDQCTWYGVTCDADGRVVELRLTMNNLKGSIPPDIVKLLQLKTLNLSMNSYIEGEMPPELGYLTNLEDLDLAINRLTGEIPHEFGNLISLQNLSLYSNYLSGPIPPEMDRLPNLSSFVSIPGNPGLYWNCYPSLLIEILEMYYGPFMDPELPYCTN